MQFQLIVTLLFAAGINAAPSVALSPRQLETIPVSIFDGPGCNTNPVPATTAHIPTDGSCFGISPIISGDTSSALISQSNLPALPAGCTVRIFTDNTCSSTNFIDITRTGDCFTFGPNLLVHSARTFGTC